MSHPQKDGSDDLGPANLTHELIGRVGGAEVREHQDIRRPGEVGEGEELLEDIEVQGRIGLHLTVHLQSRDPTP